MKIDVEFTKRMKEEEIKFYKQIKGVVGKNNVNSNQISVNSESLMALKVDNKKKILSFKKMIKSKSTQITISKTNVNSSTSLNPDECNRSCSNNDEKSSSFIKEEIFTKIKHTKPDIEI